jgi:hypothetical protein
MKQRILGVLTGGLVGYLYGWVLGRSLFDPEADVWALGAFVGALVGMMVGASAAFWHLAGPLCASAMGMYVGWLGATALLGEHLGGMGTMIALGGAFIGWRVGAGPRFRQNGAALGALVGALHIGFFGGLLVIAMLVVVLGFGAICSSLAQAPVVILCAVVGGFLGAGLGIEPFGKDYEELG